MNNPTLIYQITEEDEGNTMKHFLRKKKGLSRKLLSRMKNGQSIFLNDQFTYLDHPLKAGDTIRLVMPEEESENIIPQNLPIQIEYEDEDVMVLNKPFDQCVHPTLLHPDGTLANGVVHYWREQGFNRKFRAVNRLDRDTSGLLIVAKNQFAHQQLAIAQSNQQIERFYEAFTHGIMEKEAGTIAAPIGRKSESIIRREVRADGQEAVTHYRLLERFENASHVQLQLETGRTHQIRVHLSFIGHPLIGDDLYGGERDLLERQALHARHISFPHPRAGDQLSFSSQLPPDLDQLLKKLRK
ncbi:RNA pseudouridine synthase [Ammoniphilus oxalaticus]|uniref:Pseudouridine synthase n=1 Tax=Ammoniphilus oxalaticus TaxID=66863 RepID=A0A419SRA6_9BACL|nr:RluA family pseudouridine synthase [Ammoniphilus oxalaticus]RKD27068.1 RNA pseudouridine synthase [Ammoniphilus oxalaticus]